MGRPKGFVLLLTFTFVIVLTGLLVALLFLVTYEMRDTAFQTEDAKLLYLAEAGSERALREIRDDYVTTTQTGTSDLRGEDTSGSSNVNNPNRMRYEEDANAALEDDDSDARLRSFDANYTNTR
ncbi:MAG: hypothetical protein HYZ87_01360, partial [Candidatus Omnitrophica bacterium]|nr:hypothetical protein [Candidatus Omnitrophota bacterium]